MAVPRKEGHRAGHTGWLRAAVLGANDGILSTASLVLGVAVAHRSHSNVLVAGIAGLVAGAMAMAAGEYVSVHSQADTEQADLKRERAEQKADDKGEHKELAAIRAFGRTAHAGGAGIAQGAMRVTFWSALAMGVTAAVGALFGTAV